MHAELHSISPSEVCLKPESDNSPAPTMQNITNDQNMGELEVRLIPNQVCVTVPAVWEFIFTSVSHGKIYVSSLCSFISL